MSSRDLVFHLLDLQSRDIRIEKEEEDVRECVYESSDEESDEELGLHKRRQKPKTFSRQQREFVIHLVGATEDGHPLRVDVTGFRPTFYLRLPLDKPKTAAQCIKEYIRDQDFPSEDLQFKIIQRKIFYGFTANTYYPFLQIDMPSLALFRNLRGLFLDDKMNPATKCPLPGILRGKTVEVYEANIDPMLRFIHTQNIQPCGWVRVQNGKQAIQDVTASQWVLECDFSEITPTAAPRVSAPFLTASWDIECFSMTGDFPLAKRTWKKAAKDTLSLAKTSRDAIDLIMNSLSVGQNPVHTLPKGMTPIYCQLKVDAEKIREKMW